MEHLNEIEALVANYTPNDLRALIEVLRKKLPRPAIKTIRNRPFSKNSSRECSPDQRKIFLGSKGSLPLSSIPEINLWGSVVNQLAINRAGVLVFSNSEYLKCRAKESHVPVETLLDLDLPVTLRSDMKRNPLTSLLKDMGSRSKPPFNRIAIAEDGEILTDPQNYPCTSDTQYWLEAIPYQRALYVLNVNSQTSYGRIPASMSKIEQNQLILAEPFQVAILPLSERG